MYVYLASWRSPNGVQLLSQTPGNVTYKLSQIDALPFDAHVQIYVQIFICTYLYFSSIGSARRFTSGSRVSQDGDDHSGFCSVFLEYHAAVVGRVSKVAGCEQVLALGG